VGLLRIFFYFKLVDFEFKGTEEYNYQEQEVSIGRPLKTSVTNIFTDGFSGLGCNLPSHNAFSCYLSLVSPPVYSRRFPGLSCILSVASDQQ
jgi:hypothetical protein